jgi:hypothetical protein
MHLQVPARDRTQVRKKIETQLRHSSAKNGRAPSAPASKGGPDTYKNGVFLRIQQVNMSTRKKKSQRADRDIICGVTWLPIAIPGSVSVCPSLVHSEEV